MGVSFQHLERLQEMNLLPPGASILDIGSSNLYSATPDGLRRFLSRYSIESDYTDVFIARLADGSK